MGAGYFALVPEHRPKQALAPVASLMEIPDWYEEIPKNEPIPARPLTPSDPGVRDQTIPFGTASRKEALLRGQFVHRLLKFCQICLWLTDGQLPAASPIIWA